MPSLPVETRSFACRIFDTSTRLLIESAVIEGMLQEVIGESCGLYHAKVRFLLLFCSRRDPYVQF